MSVMHNVFYLPHNVWASPQSIFAVSHMRERSLYNEQKRRVETKMPLADVDLRQLANFSHLCAEFMMAGWLSPREEEILLEDPANRFNALVEDYDELAAKYEAPLEGDQESIERLVAYLRHRKARAGGTDPWRGRRSEAEYLELLRSSPDRYLRLNPNPPDEVRDALLQETLDRRQTSPEHAFFFIVVNGLKAIDLPMTRALQKCDYHSYVAAKVLRDNGASADVITPLVNHITSPRWIYHALRDQLLPQTDAVLQLLVKNPAWTVEWLVKSKAPLDFISRVYSMCFLSANAAPTFHDLHLWFQKRQITVVKGDARLAVA